MLDSPDPPARLGLKNIKAFLTRIGNPQDRLGQVVHVAGTNGKGSTLAFLESLLRPARIGKYTSPHLLAVNERIRLDGSEIPTPLLESLCREMSLVSGWQDLTYFEQLTVVAFEHFRRSRTDVCLLETGLGGRLDATNVVSQPAICLISSIGHDHEEYLGSDLASIASEKAGILKPEVPYIVAPNLPEAVREIESRGSSIGAIRLPYEDFGLDESRLGLPGHHQLLNANLAASAAYHMGHRVDRDRLYADQHWPGRMQTFPESCLVLDGAHNPEAAQCLRRAIDDLYPGQPRAWLLGFLSDKPAPAMARILLADSDEVIFTRPVTGDGSYPPRELGERFAEDPLVGFRALPADRPRIVAGSLYLVATILRSFS